MADTLAGPVTPEEIEGWLGCAPGNALVVMPPTPPPDRQRRLSASRAVLARAGLPVGAMGGVLVAAVTDQGLLAALCLILGVAALVPPVQSLDDDPSTATLRATGSRLTLDWGVCSRHFRWIELTGLQPKYGAADGDGFRAVERWEVSTEPGDVFCIDAGATNAEDLLRAIRQVLAAKQAGRAMWDPTPVPSTAISRLTGEDPVVDAGLSRVRQG
jgi:hypothetical protein